MSQHSCLFSLRRGDIIEYLFEREALNRMIFTHTVYTIKVEHTYYVGTVMSGESIISYHPTYDQLVRIIKKPL